MPTGQTFDFLHPSLTKEFSVRENSVLVMEFSLLVKGANSVGFFAFFLKMDPGFDIYVGNIKVFNFVQHGINNEVRDVLQSVRSLSLLVEMAHVPADHEQDGGTGAREGVRPGEHPHHDQGVAGQWQEGDRCLGQPQRHAER